MLSLKSVKAGVCDVVGMHAHGMGDLHMCKLYSLSVLYVYHLSQYMCAKRSMQHDNKKTKNKKIM